MPRISHGLFSGDSCIKSPEVIQDIKTLKTIKVNYLGASTLIGIFCEYYKISQPKLIFNCKQNLNKYGHYYGKRKLIDIYYYGENASTVLHELAHHITCERKLLVYHDNNFASAYQEVINLYKKYIA